MRNMVLTLAFLAVAPGTAPAQGVDWANKLFKGVTSHDFGNVARGAQLYHRFTVYNPYAVRLEIQGVRASCGCVTATPTTQTLEPRQTAFLDVTMDARRFTGPKTVSIFVTVGPEYVSTATLQVSAQSRADVVFNPGQVTFGVVPRGQTPTQTIEVEYAGVMEWRVSEVVKNNAPLDVKLEEWYRKPGQVGYRVHVTVKADAPAGPLKQDLVLKTNDAASPLVPVLVEANIQAALQVIPSVVSVGNTKVGATITKRVVVKGSKPFKILSIEGLGDGIEADLPLKSQDVQTVTLKYQPPKQGDLHRTLKIKTDLETVPPVNVTLEGTVGP